MSPEDTLRGLHDYVAGYVYQDAMLKGAEEIERLRNGVLMWLGQWRDSIDPNAVKALQDLVQTRGRNRSEF